MPQFTCQACGTSGSQRWMLSHDCERNQEIDETGGRCEDFPCCGHTDGDGCKTLESHTKEYWLDRMTDLEDQGYDPHEIDMILSYGD